MIESIKTVEEFLAENGEFAATTSGVSMYPLLRDREFVVKIVPAKKRLKKYDVALFYRGKQLVLHRVVKVCPDRYFIRGDNCEGGDWVKDEQIVGVLSEAKSKDKLIKVTDFSYLIYSRLIVFKHFLHSKNKKIRLFATRWIKKIKRNLKRK